MIQTGSIDCSRFSIFFGHINLMLIFKHFWAQLHVFFFLALWYYVTNNQKKKKILNKSYYKLNLALKRKKNEFFFWLQMKLPLLPQVRVGEFRGFFFLDIYEYIIFLLSKKPIVGCIISCSPPSILRLFYAPSLVYLGFNPDSCKSVGEWMPITVLTF